MNKITRRLALLLLIAMPTIAFGHRLTPVVVKDYPKDQVMVISFGANWCKPCHELKVIWQRPAVQRALSKFNHVERDGKHYPHYFDVDKDPAATHLYDVEVVPATLLVVVNEKGESKILRRIFGQCSEQQLLRFLQYDKNHVDTSIEETFIIPPVWTIKGVILIIFKIIKALLG